VVAGAFVGEKVAHALEPFTQNLKVEQPREEEVNRALAMLEQEAQSAKNYVELREDKKRELGGIVATFRQVAEEVRVYKDNPNQVVLNSEIVHSSSHKLAIKKPDGSERTLHFDLYANRRIHCLSADNASSYTVNVHSGAAYTPCEMDDTYQEQIPYDPRKLIFYFRGADRIRGEADSPLIRELASIGYTVAVVGYSEKSAHREGIKLYSKNPKEILDGLKTLNFDEAYDAACLALMLKEAGLYRDTDELNVAGLSYGSAQAVKFTAMLHNLGYGHNDTNLILYAGLHDLFEDIKTDNGFRMGNAVMSIYARQTLTRGQMIESSSAHILPKCASWENKPKVTLVVGDSDEVINPRGTISLAKQLAACAIPAKLIVNPGGKHIFTFPSNEDFYQTWVESNPDLKPPYIPEDATRFQKNTYIMRSFLRDINWSLPEDDYPL